MNLTQEQREALREIVRCKLRLWDANSVAETCLGRDIDTDSDVLGYTLVGLSTVADADSLSDEQLSDMFELD